MLLYVDKKKQKRRKIKIFSLILGGALVILANVIHFNTALHQTDKHLTNYKNLQITQNWYDKADVVCLFSDKKKIIRAIVIPQKITAENLLTTALAFSRLTEPRQITFTNEVPEKEYLSQLYAVMSPQSKDIPSLETIHITTDVSQITQLINRQKLSPSVLHYNQTSKLPENPELQQLIETHFPPLPQPKDKQEEELLAISSFAQTHQKELQNLITSPDKPTAFISQNFMLQNISVCLSSASKTSCSINPDNSLQKNIHTALAHLPNEPVQKLYLLTSLKKISQNDEIPQNDGILFRFEERETYLLSQKGFQNSNISNIYAYLKQQAGLNPEYQSQNMEFYKFKTKEITINDNI